MTPPFWLIAGREFRAYAATTSFWVALAAGPLLMGVAATAGGAFAGPSPSPASAPATLTLASAPGGVVEARFSPNFPLSATGRDQVLRTLERDGRLGGRLRAAPAPASAPVDAAALSRFAQVMILWMTLTGSLGMLLQAVVRERANRALESLLAAASPADIIAGKLIGVGGVSLLVVGTWLGSSVALAGLAARSAGLAGALAQGLAQPAALVRAGVVYLIAYAFYGLVTVAIGARARDNADAQNLARPMFAVLLMVFFAALATAGGAAKLDWLVFAPPFTPFMLLMRPPAPGTEFAALVLLAAATAAAAWFAGRSVTLDQARMFGRS